MHCFCRIRHLSFTCLKNKSLVNTPFYFPELWFVKQAWCVLAFSYRWLCSLWWNVVIQSSSELKPSQILNILRFVLVRHSIWGKECLPDIWRLWAWKNNHRNVSLFLKVHWKGFPSFRVEKNPFGLRGVKWVIILTITRLQKHIKPLWL